MSAETDVWPEPTAECRPWTRWWWLGSAVDRETITRLMETYAAAGLGGVEISNIYGINGRRTATSSISRRPGWTGFGTRSARQTGWE